MAVAVATLGVICWDFCELGGKDGDCRSAGTGVLGSWDFIVSIASGTVFRFVVPEFETWV